MRSRPFLVLALTITLLATACHSEPINPWGGVKILHHTQAKADQARLWARNNGAPLFFRNLVAVYWREAPKRGGVRADVAYAQAAKETGFGRYGGSVTPAFKNPCGLKTTTGGANGDPNAHQRFPNWTAGVRACLDHLALYAGAPGYPRPTTQDPRHFASLAGTARTVQRLGTRWAPSADYGRSILRDYLSPMMKTVVGSQGAAATTEETSTTTPPAPSTTETLPPVAPTTTAPADPPEPTPTTVTDDPGTTTSLPP